jgi:hypothetical protein
VATCNAGFSDCNNNPADGCETSLKTNDNCGACGSSCSVANGSSTCTSGTCQVATCNAGFSDCDGNPANGCETPLNTLDHCGACGSSCSVRNGAASCATGSCQVATCNAGFSDCNGNPADGCEAALNTLDHCGACGSSCSVANGAASCESGSCQVATCNAGFSDCDGNPANGCETRLDTNDNCGACGSACSVANGAASCGGGTCQVAACNTGFSNCNGLASDGCEADLRTTDHCGACGNACAPVPNGTNSCANGQCAIATCNAGFGDCNNQYADGCESSTSTSTEHCGACGASCPAVQNGTGTCTGGQCAIASCQAGFANCNGQLVDGCETPLSAVGSCGACGNVCSLPNANEACVSGTCAIATCDAGFADCDGNPVNGCETNTKTTIGSCGACGNVCSVANGTPACVNGACAVATCSTGFGNCNNNPGDGCETNKNTSVDNCGACGAVCNLPNANEACISGACAVASCQAGFANCDNIGANGCESPLNTVSHCGSCAACPAIANASSVCAADGTCQFVSCNAGFGNCDGNLANGCETNLTTTPTSCGACGNVCTVAQGVGACVNGTCTVGTCVPEFGNCDGNVANGCETHTFSSIDHCGACGRACQRANATELCLAGTCSGTCDPGFADCNNDMTLPQSNGCEINLQTNAGNCGACGRACQPGQVCVNGGCQGDAMIPTSQCGAGPLSGTTCAENPLPGGFQPSTAAQCQASCLSNPSCAYAILYGSGPSGFCHRYASCSSCQVSGTVNTKWVKVVCAAGLVDCANTPGSSCDTNLSTSVNNCGACGNVCNLANANEACVNGACAISTCAAGFANCDGNTANGCETPLDTTSNCGACGNVCNLQNASEACVSNACAVTACDPGFGNCDGSAANGCEASTSTVSNCGACGNVCDFPNSNEACVNASCQIGSCSASFANCDGNLATGCEINVSTSVNNCGACGNVCNLLNANEACVNGACTIQSCIGTTRNCDGNTANGCESSIASDPGNCGACGNVCPQGTTCSGSACHGTYMAPTSVCSATPNVTGSASTCGSQSLLSGREMTLSDCMNFCRGTPACTYIALYNIGGPYPNYGFCNLYSSSCTSPCQNGGANQNVKYIKTVLP